MAKTPPVGVRLDPAVRAELEKMAEQEGRSLSNLIAAICKQHVEARKGGR